MKKADDAAWRTSDDAGTIAWLHAVLTHVGVVDVNEHFCSSCFEKCLDCVPHMNSLSIRDSLAYRPNSAENYSVSEKSKPLDIVQ